MNTTQPRTYRKRKPGGKDEPKNATNDEPKSKSQKDEVCNFQYSFIMLNIFSQLP